MIVHAQDRQEFRFLVGVQPPLTQEQEKSLTERLLSADPYTSMHFDRAAGVFEILTDQPLQREQCENLLQQMRAPSISSWRSVYPRGIIRSPMDAPGSPLFFDTGNPTADEARYQTEKLQWLKTNAPPSDAPLKETK